MNFKWKDIVDINGTIYYSTFKEAINAKQKVIELLCAKYKDDYDMYIDNLNDFDKKIPRFDFKEYYGI